jgi:hypothetical protein
MRIPYTGALPPPSIIPTNANTITGAIAALSKFLTSPPSLSLQDGGGDPQSTVILSGAGISVASGLADYRGTNGTYRQNKTYRPIYYHEFLANHEARKRYWARSFLGWTNCTLTNSLLSWHIVRELRSFDTSLSKDNSYLALKTSLGSQNFRREALLT